jgi:hypothetical protein
MPFLVEPLPLSQGGVVESPVRPLAESLPRAPGWHWSKDGIYRRRTSVFFLARRERLRKVKGQCLTMLERQFTRQLKQTVPLLKDYGRHPFAAARRKADEPRPKRPGLYSG